jgi:hypothetical protein
MISHVKYLWIILVEHVFLSNKKRKKKPGIKESKKTLIKARLTRAQSNFHEKNDQGDSSLSLDSKGSGMRKSCLKNTDERRSSRKESLNGTKVRFNKEVGDYSEVEEEAKIEENRRKYKKVTVNNEIIATV